MNTGDRSVEKRGALPSYEMRQEIRGRLHVLTSFHPCGVQVRTMQSKHLIDCELSPPQGHVSAMPTEGKHDPIRTTQAEAMIGRFFTDNIGHLYFTCTPNPFINS